MNIALFDFDGTLTDSDCFTAFIRFATPWWRLWPATLLVLPLYVFYKFRLLQTTSLRSCMIWLAFAGRSEKTLRHLGEVFAREVIPLRLRPQMLARMHEHIDNGDTVCLVSASLSYYLQPFCLDIGIRCISSQVKTSGRRSSGRYFGHDCTGEHKARQVKEAFHLSSYDKVYAYGDTPEDNAMLALADVKVYRGLEVPARNRTLSP